LAVRVRETGLLLPNETMTGAPVVRFVNVIRPIVYAAARGFYTTLTVSSTCAPLLRAVFKVAADTASAMFNSRHTETASVGAVRRPALFSLVIAAGATEHTFLLGLAPPAGTRQVAATLPSTGDRLGVVTLPLTDTRALWSPTNARPVANLPLHPACVQARPRRLRLA
jgi:hypothetical protein